MWSKQQRWCTERFWPKVISLKILEIKLKGAHRKLISVLPAIRHRWTRPALIPAKQAGTRFAYPGWMEGWVDLGAGHIDYRNGSPVHHPSNNWVQSGVTRPRSHHTWTWSERKMKQVSICCGQVLHRNFLCHSNSLTSPTVLSSDSELGQATNILWLIETANIHKLNGTWNTSVFAVNRVLRCDV